MDLSARRDDEDARKLGLAPEGEGPRHLQHDDGSWSFVHPDGWPMDPDDYAKLHAHRANAFAAVSYVPVDEDLLLAARRGLLETIGVEPISVRDSEV
ncbi:hypothetical protein [Nocardia sp. NPDC019304]|uniref:hypothetical protein n=2 Tax=Nocardia TaxID=1817 RepID=UPI0033D459E4